MEQPQEVLDTILEHLRYKLMTEGEDKTLANAGDIHYCTQKPLTLGLHALAVSCVVTRQASVSQMSFPWEPMYAPNDSDAACVRLCFLLIAICAKAVAACS